MTYHDWINSASEAKRYWHARPEITIALKRRTRTGWRRHLRIGSVPLIRLRTHHFLLLRPPFLAR